ncbi:MAG TPA: hypothetical protein VEI03_19665 [Stellaceae bacterium]|nr:hypothetical protein [Stellaceae bacterium]
MRDMFRSSRTLAVLLPLLASLGMPALAQDRLAEAGGGLLVSPTYLLFDGRERSKSMILTNRGDAPETYRISLINRRQMPDGQLVETAEPAGDAGFASTLVRYAPRQVVLKPNQPQTIRLLLQLPADLPDGEYRSHVLLQQVPTVHADDVANPNATGLSMRIRAVFGITVPLVVRKGNLTAMAALSDLKPVRLADGHNGLSLHLDRTGTRSLRGDLTVLIDGEPAGWLNGINVFLSTPYRELVVPLTTAGELKGHRIAVEFTEGEDTLSAATAKQSLSP